MFYLLSENKPETLENSVIAQFDQSYVNFCSLRRLCLSWFTNWGAQRKLLFVNIKNRKTEKELTVNSFDILKGERKKSNNSRFVVKCMTEPFNLACF